MNHEPINVHIRHPFQLVAEAIDMALASSLKFRSKVAGSDGPLEGDVLILEPRSALQMLTSEHFSDQRIIAIATATRAFEVRSVLSAGAWGFLLTTSSLAEVILCIEEVVAGRRYITPQAAQCALAAMPQSELTPREMKVLSLVSDGLCNKSIAKALEVSDGTVKTHVKAILSKLGAASRTQATRFAMERGLVTH